MPAWEADLRYEMNTMQSLPHTVAYVETGTHMYWTIKEVRWATRVSVDPSARKQQRLRRRTAGRRLLAGGRDRPGENANVQLGPGLQSDSY